MKGMIEVRFFMFLSDLCRQRQWPTPLPLEIEGEMSGTALLERLEVPADRVEALLINGKSSWPEEAVIRPGDRVALLPPGTPGPYRVMLGLRKPDGGNRRG